jgi:hypothetical protein
MPIPILSHSNVGSTFLFAEYQIVSSAQATLDATFANDTSDGGIGDAFCAGQWRR